MTRSVFIIALHNLIRWRPIPPLTKLTAIVVLAITAGVFTLCIAVGLGFRGDPGKWFGEGKPGTLLPATLLMLSGLLALKLASRWTGGQRRRAVLGWLIMGAAFAVAGLDDGLKLHERVDDWIWLWLTERKPQKGNSLDAALVLAYALPALLAAGLLARWLCRCPGALKSWSVAAACFFAMVLCDWSSSSYVGEEMLKGVSAAWIFIGTAAAEHRFTPPPPRTPSRLEAHRCRWERVASVNTD